MRVRNLIGRIVIVALAAVLAGYGLARLYVWVQARRGVGDLARLAEPYAEVEWEGVRAGVDGEIRLHGLTVHPRGLNDTITIDTLEIQTSQGLVPNELAHRLAEGRLPAYLQIDARNLAFPVGGPLFRRLDAITGGYLWGTPLDSLGCKGVHHLGRSILENLDGQVLHANVELRLRMHRPTRRLALAMDVDLQKLAVTTLEATMDLGRQDLPLDQPSVLRSLPVTLTELRVRHTDRGFNSNRNLLCARQLDIPVDAFLRRHLDAVRASYQDHIPAPNAALFTQYRDFAAHGGDILIDLNPKRPISLAELAEMHGWPLSDRLQPLLAINGVPIHSPAAAWYPWTDKDGSAERSGGTTTAETSAEKPAFHDVAVSDLSRYLGKQARIFTQDGVQHKGVIEKIGADSVTLRWELSGGYMRFSIADDKIKQAQVFH